ncbi:2-hydroxy-3-oxopropionate reductase [Salinifilum aidingensis]
MTASVGVVGLGPMGTALAQRLAECGIATAATSRSASTREAAAERGVHVVPDVPALVESVSERPVIVTSLPSGPEVRAACLDANGLQDSGLHEFVLVDTSTCAPRDSADLAAELRRRGCAAVDAPVSGGPAAARDGNLSVMAGGAQDDLDAADAVLRAIAGRLVVCGGPGAGQVAKACNQMVVAANLATVAEALVTASALGADPACVREALQGGYAASRVLDLHGERMLQRDFSLGGAARTHLKDIGIIRELTEGVADNRVFEQAAEMMAELVEDGGADLDHSAVVRIAEKRSGHRLP